MTGVDVLEGVRGTYTTEVGAYEALRAQGFHDVERAFDGLFKEIPVSFAQRGDVGTVTGLVDVEEMPAAVLFIDRGVIGRGQAGLVRLPRERASRAFRIG